MGWETRIFVEIPNESVQNHWTVRHAPFAQAFLAGCAIQPSSKDRTDHYLGHPNVDRSHEIGFKERGGGGTLEMKLVAAREGDLEYWTKYHSGVVLPSTYKTMADYRAFLQSLPRDNRIAALLNVEQFDRVTVHKRRVRLNVGGLGGEETDCEFVLGNHRILLRSWAIEGDYVQMVQQHHAAWWQRIQSASMVSGQTAPRFWIASYPGMIVELSQLISTKGVDGSIAMNGVHEKERQPADGQPPPKRRKSLPEHQ